MGAGGIKNGQKNPTSYSRIKARLSAFFPLYRHTTVLGTEIMTFCSYICNQSQHSTALEIAELCCDWLKDEQKLEFPSYDCEIVHVQHYLRKRAYVLGLKGDSERPIFASN